MKQVVTAVGLARQWSALLVLVVLVLATLSADMVGVGSRQSAQIVYAQTATAVGQGLAGAWRAKVQFQSGAFASVKDLEFMYAFNGGGTMTESSNYDAYPPVPPAYGVWRQTNAKQFEARYEFYSTRLPETRDSAAAGAGWLPSGRGVLTETITLSDDGNAFTSEIKLELLDQAGKAVEGGGTATGAGVRIVF